MAEQRARKIGARDCVQHLGVIIVVSDTGNWR